jgi:hypothetical protein
MLSMGFCTTNGCYYLIFKDLFCVINRALTVV